MLITTVYRTSLTAMPILFTYALFIKKKKKGTKMGNKTFQMSGPSEGSKGNFILQHITKDNHNHVTLDPHMYFILQSSTSRSSKRLCMKSNKSSPLSLFLPRTFCRWKKWAKGIPPEEALPMQPPKRERSFPHSKFGFDKKDLSACFCNLCWKVVFLFIYFLQPMLVDSTIKWL